MNDHPSMHDAEPWDVAAQRPFGWLDLGSMLIMTAVVLVCAALPPRRLLIHTGLRLVIAGAFAICGLILPGIVGRASAFIGHAFAFLAIFGLAAHIEGAVLTPVIDRIDGSNRE